MISDEIIASLSCAHAKDKHIVEKPVSISCGHYVCKKCILASNHRQMKCRLCGENNQIDLNKMKESQLIKQIIEQNLDQLYRVIQKKFEASMARFKDFANKIDENVDMKIDNIKKDIANRVKFLKNELDVINENLQQELNKIKKKLKNWKLDDKKTKKFDIDTFERELVDLRNYVTNKQNQTEEKFYDYQDTVLYMNSLIDKMRTIDPQISFEISETTIDKSIIGNIFCNYQSNNPKASDTDIMQLVESSRYDIVETTVETHDMCVLSNDRLLVADFKNKSLNLFDENFKIVQHIDKIGNQTFVPSSITSNESEIFVVDYLNSRIIKTDLSINYIDAVGSPGSGSLQFKNPVGIAFYNKSIYVCDQDNSRIQKLSNNFKYEASYRLDYCPYNIHISNGVVCVRSNSAAPAIRFYDLATFKLRFKYDGHNGFIGLINSQFYEYYKENQKIYCYDDDGVQIKEIQTNNNIGYYDGGIGYFNGRVVIWSKSNRVIIS